MILYRNSKLTIACDNCYAKLKTLSDEERDQLERLTDGSTLGSQFCDEVCSDAYRKPERRKLQAA